jgi:hypothetical protein
VELSGSGQGKPQPPRVVVIAAYRLRAGG